MDTSNTQPLIKATRFFADRGVFGLVWIDQNLIVQRCFGLTAAFVTQGLPLTDTVFAFIGSEDFIASFQADPSLSLELPGVVIVTSPDTPDRFNLSLFYDPLQSCYVLLIIRATLDATLELELVRHVRARLMAEADTSLKARELLAANRDLEQFAAIVSHDLKAPMRALQYLTEDVEAAAERGNPAELRAQLALVKTQAQRMSSMLSGLLDYSSVGRKAIAVEQVDTLAIARSIAGSIPHGTGITVRVEGTWPTINSLKAPLDLILRNLIDNAVKHHDLDAGTVVMTCVEIVDELVIAVADDGPGIPPEHRAAVFLPFRTLEIPGRSTSVRPTSGIGLGLALVQRTVESAGGRINLIASDAGARGATFEVRWPKNLGATALLA